jgi:hypothetical protein
LSKIPEDDVDLVAVEDVLEVAPVELFEVLAEPDELEDEPDEPDELDEPDEPDEPDEEEPLAEAVVGLKLMLPAPNPILGA